MLDEEQVVWKLRKIAEDLFEDHPVLSNEICDVIQIIEAQQRKTRSEAKVDIVGLIRPLLQHTIQLKTLEHNNIEPPKSWKKEIEGFRQDVIGSNETEHFRSGIFFTENELQSISVNEMKSAMRKAIRKLGDGWPDIEIPEEVQKAKQAEDLGITFS